MKSFLGPHGYDVWYSGVTRYIDSKKPKTAVKKELKKNNKITMDFILEGLPYPIKVKVGQCSSTKELWNKLHSFYLKESSLEHVDHDK
jgi:hypothetical protein